MLITRTRCGLWVRALTSPVPTFSFSPNTVPKRFVMYSRTKPSSWIGTSACHWYMIWWKGWLTCTTATWTCMASWDQEIVSSMAVLCWKSPTLDCEHWRCLQNSSRIKTTTTVEWHFNVTYGGCWHFSLHRQSCCGLHRNYCLWLSFPEPQRHRRATSIRLP